MTSELRLLVSVPTAPCLSMRRVEVPFRSASLRAMARPTAPAPTTTWVKSALGVEEVENGQCVCNFRLNARANMSGMETKGSSTYT